MPEIRNKMNPYKGAIRETLSPPAINAGEMSPAACTAFNALYIPKVCPSNPNKKAKLPINMINEFCLANFFTSRFDE